MLSTCLICEKHQGRGALASAVVWSTDEVVVSHRGTDSDGRGVLGYLFVETRRHVQSWDLMTVHEATALAEASWLGARCLRRLLATEGVYTAIVGRHVEHVHQHVFARHVGTPADVGWFESPSWPDAPRVPRSGLADFASQLATARERL